MADILEREFIYVWYWFTVQFEQIAPWWVAGMALGSAVSVFAGARIGSAMRALAGGGNAARGMVTASVLGIASPLCLYGTVPVCGSFSQQGIRDDWLAAFMMSSILLNPQLIVVSAALGWKALTVRIVSCFTCGIAAGLLVRRFFRETGFFRLEKVKPPENRDVHPHPALRFLFSFARNVRATGPSFLLGVLLSALFTRYVPSAWIESLFGRGNAFGTLMAATVGVPLYACNGGTVPLLQVWLKTGMSLGAAAAFMITGPATKITNLGALRMVLGARRFALYLLFTVLFALVTGWAVNLALAVC